MPHERAAGSKRRTRRCSSSSSAGDSDVPGTIHKSSGVKKKLSKPDRCLKFQSQKVNSTIVLKDSSAELSDDDFEPKSSQRLKPRFPKKRKSKEPAVDQGGALHAGVTKVKNEGSSSGRSTPQRHWVLLDSHAEDIGCIARVLDDQVGSFKKRYLEHSWEENMLPLALTEIQRYVKRAVQSLCDVSEDLRSLSNCNDENLPLKAENSTTDALKDSDVDDEKTINGESKEIEKKNATEICQSTTLDTNAESKSKESRKGRRCGSTDSEAYVNPGLSHKIQRCGSMESVGIASVGSPKSRSCDSDTQEAPAESRDLTGTSDALADTNHNVSRDMFSDTDHSEQTEYQNGEHFQSDDNCGQPSKITQSTKSLDCKANLLADSSSDSEAEEREAGSSSNEIVASSSDSDSQIESPCSSLLPQPKKSAFNINNSDAYRSDLKLQEKCFVKLSKLSASDEKKYMELAGSYYDKSDIADSGSDHSVENLTNLNNLKWKGKGSDNDSETNGTSSDMNCKEKKYTGKDKSKEKEKLADFMNKVSADTSEGETSFEKPSVECNVAPEENSTINDVHKKLLLESSESDNGQSDNETEKMLGAKEKVQEGTEESGPVLSDAFESPNPGNPKSDNEKSDNEKLEKEQSDDESICKKEKKKWRNNHLLTGKLSDTDTSDEDKRYEKRKLKLEVDKDSRKTKETPKKKDSDIEVISDDPQSSSSEDFVKKKPKRTVKKSSCSSSSEEEKPKKKRRRIKVQNSSSSDDEAQDKDAESPSKGRKKIRHVISEEDLEKGTKLAAKEEEERLKRIADRQKMYDELYETVQKGFHVIEKLVLDFDEKTKEPLVEVDKSLVKKLKPHQVKGVKFMWDACFESLKRIKSSPGSGCILAHCMGLGKTFQVVTLVHTLFKYRATNVERVLVVCPVSTVLNWVNEFDKWLNGVRGGPEIEVFEMTRCKQNMDRSYKLREWMESGGVMVIGYDMYRNLTNPQSKRVRATIMRTFQSALVDPGPDLVICDEGHLLKNESTGTSKAMTRIRTRRRIILTGTPLQNNLNEYHCMVQFVKPNLLGTSKEFRNRFVNPITNGQFEDSTSHDVKRMKRRAHVLHKTLEGCVQRFDYSVLTPYLPPKEEYVISIRITDTQEKLYRHYLENDSSRGSAGKGAQLFADFQQLQRVWTHPRVLKMSQERNELKAEKEDQSDSEGSLKDFIDDGSASDTSSPSSSSEEDDDVVCLSDESGTKGKKKAAKPVRRTRANKDLSPEPEPIQPTKGAEWWEQYVQESDFEDLRASPKLQLLFSILKECEENGEKLLVFSQSLFSLDVIQYFLNKVDEATQKGVEDENLDGHQGSWTFGVDYFRLDGSTPTDLRSTWCNIFNRTSNLKARLFLISTRAGGLGINLVAANRVIIFDASWNPSHDVQSIFRVYRFGQTKPCFIYRFLAQGTMEEKIYQRQVTKMSLACRVVDELQVERYYKMADLQELYMFTPADRDKFEVPKLPKDHLFAELLKKHQSLITTYHEHDSLLENKEEEELNEDERKAAWEDYENEKKGPVLQQGMPGFDLPSLDQIKEAMRLREPDKTEEELDQAAIASYRQMILYQQQQQQHQQRVIQLQRLHQQQQQQQMMQQRMQYMQQNMPQNQQPLQPLLQHNLPNSYQTYQDQLRYAMQHQQAQHYPQYQQPLAGSSQSYASGMPSTSMANYPRQGQAPLPAILKKPSQLPSSSQQK